MRVIIRKNLIFFQKTLVASLYHSLLLTLLPYSDES